MPLINVLIKIIFFTNIFLAVEQLIMASIRGDYRSVIDILTHEHDQKDDHRHGHGHGQGQGQGHGPESNLDPEISLIGPNSTDKVRHEHGGGGGKEEIFCRALFPLSSQILNEAEVYLPL